MNRRLNRVSQIVQIIEHQKEIIEFRLREIAQRRALELERLATLVKELQANIDQFEKKLNDSLILSSDEVDFLFGTASALFQKIEGKKRVIEGIEEEWATFQTLFLEAYKKKKAVDIVQHKMMAQEMKAETLMEQKNMDYLTLLNWSKPC